MIGLLFAWLVVRDTALERFTDAAPAAALRFPPASGAALAAEGWSHMVATGGEDDRITRRLSAEALSREPSNASAIALSAMIAGADGQLNRARALMETARNRDPRLVPARYWLLDHDMRSGDYAAGLNEVGPALRLRPGTSEAIMALVMGLLDLPGGEAAVHAKLASRPFWRADFFETEARLPGHARRLLALLRALPPTGKRDEGMREQQAVFSAAVLQGEEIEAYRLWQARAGPSKGAIYDPDFHGLPGAPPFNWTLAQGSGANAAIAASGDLPEGGVLNLSFEGASPALLAEQYALPAPGRSRFRFRARSVGETGTARLVAQIRCSRGDTLLASITIGPVSTSMASYGTDLDIPATCPAVSVQFRGEPADAPGAFDIQVTGVGLDRIDSR